MIKLSAKKIEGSKYTKTSVKVDGAYNTLVDEFAAILASVDKAEPTLIGDALTLMVAGAIEGVTRI